jgi:hypothetical protein
MGAANAGLVPPAELRLKAINSGLVKTDNISFKNTPDKN